MNNQLVYRAAIYVRLSKEDGDSFSFGKNESNSITNQKLLIKSFLDNLPDIEVVETFEDDGFTGTNFERPGFQRMMDAIRAKKINCVVVKDFSRLGREYLEAGNLIEKIFPQLGVRFISVNDDYDSLRARTQTDNIIVPFKNLLNEQYSRDTSGKIRSALTVKRQQGLFVGAFAVYGYFRDPEDKNHMIIDKEAAEVVRDIFKMKIAGMSYTAIANRLSALKIPSPAEYKKLCGEKYRSGFKSNVSAEWSATAVKRILTNEVYCGHMIQGKRRKISYKVKAEEQIAPEKWSRVENTHDAIISVATFNEAQRLLTEDTRVGVDNEIHPLAGKVFCADCGGAMVRKMVPAGKAKYFYYVCGNNKANSKWCSPHSIRAENLEATVFAALQAHIAVILDMDKALSELDQLVWEQREINKLQHQIEILDAEIQQNEELRRSVYEDFKTGLIEKSDYESLRKGFAAKIEDAKKAQESKDLSRFGRNYLEVGNYLEHLFPFLGVRFIAVNDMYDSADYSGANMGVDLAFKNILHDYYSKDLSAKVRTAQRSRMMTGKYVNVPPYGYLRDPMDKHHLIPDPATAPVVKDIFSMIIAGRTTADVAKYLNTSNAPTPSEAKGTKRREETLSEKQHIWTHRAVLNILNNYKYTGAMVNHTRENQTLRARSQKRLSESEWIVNEGMHEALVTHEDYHRAHQALRTVKKCTHKKPDQLTGVYYCACCGRRLRRTHGLTTYLTCETPYYQEGADCATIRWKLPEIEALVLDSFRMHISYLTSLRVKRKPCKENPAKQYISEMAQLKKQLDQFQAEKVGLYTDYKTGKMSREAFIERKALQARETEIISSRLNEARNAYESFLAQKAALEEAEEKLSQLIPDYQVSEEEMLQLMYRGIERVLISNNGTIDVIWKYEDIFKVFSLVS